MIVDQRNNATRYPGSPDVPRVAVHNLPPLHLVGSGVRRSESLRPTPVPEPKERRRRAAKDKNSGVHSANQDLPPPKKERKKRTTNKHSKEEHPPTKPAKPFTSDRGPLPGPGSFKIAYGYSKSSPEPVSSNVSGSSRSVQLSPTSATPRAPSRVVDEDYDEGVDWLGKHHTEHQKCQPQT